MLGHDSFQLVRWRCLLRWSKAIEAYSGHPSGQFFCKGTIHQVYSDRISPALCFAQRERSSQHLRSGGKVSASSRQFWRVDSALTALLADSLTVAVHPFKKSFIHAGFVNLNTDGHRFGKREPRGCLTTPNGVASFSPRLARACESLPWVTEPNSSFHSRAKRGERDASIQKLYSPVSSPRQL